MSALVNIPTTNAGSDLRVFGLAGSTDFGNGGGYGFVISSDASAIRASFNGNNVNSAASLTGSLNTTMLIVSQLSIVSGVDTVTVWLNPTLSTLPTTGGVSVTGTFSTPGTLYGGFRGGTAFSGIVDELRVGTSYFDVVPTTVPEPSTYTLMGLGLGALWVLRCRKAA
jgi:hypothetical protein